MTPKVRRMLCLAPISMTTHGFNHNVPCRQCRSCKLNKQREWVGRILLEARSHKHSTFTTMTYDEKHVSPVYYEEMERWQKRFRKELKARTGERCRFYTIGEYGTRTARPHYHSLIFGPSPLISEAILQTTWSKGFVTAFPMQLTHAPYIARYTTKKLQAKETPQSFPEFAIMSRKPALGTAYIKIMIESLRNRLTRGQISAETILDTVKCIRLDGKRYPLSQLFRDQIIKELGPAFVPLLAPLITAHFKTREQWSEPDSGPAIQSARQSLLILNAFKEHPNVS